MTCDSQWHGIIIATEPKLLGFGNGGKRRWCRGHVSRSCFSSTRSWRKPTANAVEKPGIFGGLFCLELRPMFSTGLRPCTGVAKQNVAQTRESKFSKRSFFKRNVTKFAPQDSHVLPFPKMPFQASPIHIYLLSITYCILYILYIYYIISYYIILYHIISYHIILYYIIIYRYYLYIYII